LARAVQDGRFRLDLYYRLNIINIQIPPLRERKEDIVELAEFFVERFRKVFNKEVAFFPDKIIELFMKHEWPGNIRELENVIQRAVLMAKSEVISENDIVFDNQYPIVTEENYFNKLINKLQDKPFKELISEVESDIILHSLKSLGSVQQVAKFLRIGKTALYDKIKRFELPTKLK
jgi:transcriptional regulator with PAS, ATPase and Fis domain